MLVSRFLNIFKVKALIDGEMLELGRTFCTFKQAEDYCKQHNYDVYVIDWSER